MHESIYSIINCHNKLIITYGVSSGGNEESGTLSVNEMGVVTFVEGKGSLLRSSSSEKSGEEGGEV